MRLVAASHQVAAARPVLIAVSALLEVAFVSRLF